MKEITEKQNNNYKKVLAVLIGLLLVANVTAYVVYSNIIVTAHVAEALSTEEFHLDLSAYPGQTISKNFTITNEADVSLSTELTWNETLNEDGVTYTTDMPKTVELAPGDNEIKISITFESDTETGDFEGNVELRRV